MESRLLNNAKDLAVDIVKLCRSISDEKHEYILTKQLIRSGTSIGANIHESNYAHGRADFAAKLQIALKECYETEYWLELLNRTGDVSDDTYHILSNRCGGIRRMLISSLNTVKKNAN